MGKQKRRGREEKRSPFQGDFQNDRKTIEKARLKTPTNRVG